VNRSVGFVDDFSRKIRKRESPFHDRLYRLAKRIRSFEVPAIKPLYGLLYRERKVRLAVWRNVIRVFYTTPLFKSRCDHVGKRLLLIGGVPLVMGHLRIRLGDDVVIHGVSTFTGAKVFDRPTLSVGNSSYLGYQLTIGVGCDVTIGDNVLIADRVTILSYDGHPANPEHRHLPAAPESSRPVIIEDKVWIGTGSIIMKGVRVGRNSIIAAGSVVTQKIPPDSLVIGNPARVFPLVY
jgi:acetyltransferase-like isoleucine patch superfamily enzyme